MGLKTITVLTAIIALAGCSYEAERKIVVEGQPTFEVFCVDGVEYLSRDEGYRGYMAVKFNRDSTVSTCEGKRNAY